MKKRHAILHNNKGLTLIEVIVSLGILGMILVPTLALFGGSLTNTRFTQESIDNKYLAEKYMEIVKATPISGLPVTLGISDEEADKAIDDLLHKDTVNFATISPEDGVTITLEETGYKTESGENSFIFGKATETPRILDIGSGDNEIKIIANIFPGWIKLDINGAPETYYIASNNDESYAFKVRLSETVISPEITVTNSTGKKLEFYCVNEKVGGDGNIIYHANRKLPAFFIKEGEVSYHDFTVTPENKRITDEYEELFTGDEQLTLAYTVTVTVANEKGRYEIESIKAIYK